MELFLVLVQTVCDIVELVLKISEHFGSKKQP